LLLETVAYNGINGKGGEGEKECFFMWYPLHRSALKYDLQWSFF